MSFNLFNILMGNTDKEIRFSGVSVTDIYALQIPLLERLFKFLNWVCQAYVCGNLILQMSV